VLEAGLPLFLMRFLSLRLKPKAVAVPKIGRGPGTEAVPPEVPPLPELPLPPPPLVGPINVAWTQT
jgi:hypothetical protein